MEKIKEFENCKINNLESIQGGRMVMKYSTAKDVDDKDVYDNDGKLLRTVTDLDSWFNRD